MRDDGIQRGLAARGWAHLPGAGVDALAALPRALGARVIQRTDVAVLPGRALVTSDRALDFHSDHHRADWIAWWCVRQTSAGGETLLADAEAAFASLPGPEQARLANIRLMEHDVFAGDAGTHPLVVERGARRLFYWSFWLVAEGLGAADRAACEAFARAVRAHQVASIRLAPDDLLVIDNRRILHGRTAIVGSRDRHLVRHWLAATRPETQASSTSPTHPESP